MDKLTPEQEKLATDNMKLVHYFANKYKGMLTSSASYSYDDLVAEGYVGLVRAAKNFDESRGLKFSSLAGKYIKFSMLNFINRQVPLTHVGGHITNLAAMIASKGLSDAPAETIAEELAVSLEWASLAQQYLDTKESLSLDAPINKNGEDKTLTLLDKIEQTKDMDLDGRLLIQAVMGV